MTEMREYLATKTEPTQDKNLIVNAEFNKEVKKKHDLIRARINAQAAAIAEAEKQEKLRKFQEIINAEAHRKREAERLQKEKEDAARKAYMEKQLKE